MLKIFENKAASYDWREAGDPRISLTDRIAAIEAEIADQQTRRERERRAAIIAERAPDFEPIDRTITALTRQLSDVRAQHVASLDEPKRRAAYEQAEAKLHADVSEWTDRAIARAREFQAVLDEGKALGARLEATCGQAHPYGAGIGFRPGRFRGKPWLAILNAERLHEALGRWQKFAAECRGGK